MRQRSIGLVVWLGLWCGSQTVAVAQDHVPNLIPVTGVVVDASGQPLRGLTPISFAIYGESDGGEALWREEQMVTLDEHGRFAAWLGSVSEGVPIGLFQLGAARWLGVQASDLPEQPRVRLLSVPYALKAADAETLGGLPASAFVRAAIDGEPPAGGHRVGPAAGLDTLQSPISGTAPVTAAEGFAGGAPFFGTLLGQGALASNTTAR